MRASADPLHPWHDPREDVFSLRCYVRGRHVLAVSADEEGGAVECPLRDPDGRITPRPGGAMLLVRSTYSEPGAVRLVRDEP